MDASGIDRVRSNHVNIEDRVIRNASVTDDRRRVYKQKPNGKTGRCQPIKTEVLAPFGAYFGMDCGIPAVIRAINESNVRGVWLILVVIGILTVIAILYGRAFTGRVFKQSPPVIDDSAPTSTIVTADQGKEQLDKEHTSLSSVLQDTPVHERKEMNL